MSNRNQYERTAKNNKKMLSNKPDMPNIEAKIQETDESTSTASQQLSENVQSTSPNIESIFFSNNPFTPLENETETETRPIPRTPKPPPIFVRNIQNYKLFCKQLNERVGDGKYLCINRVQDTKIAPDSSDSYREIIKYLSEVNAQFHTYQLKEERALRVVIRGLHHTTPIDEIKEELNDLGFKVKNASNVLRQHDKIPLPLFFVDIEQSSLAPKIYNITKLYHTRVTIEKPYTKREIVQCHSCQRFGHTKTYCHQTPRCVKCGGTHKSEDCKKSSDVPATCAHCSENHPANYKGCRIYQELKKRTLPNRPQNNQSPRPPSRTYQPGISYAQVLSRQELSMQPQHPEQQPHYHPAPPISHVPPPPQSTDMSSILNTFLSRFESKIESMLSPILTLLTQIISKLIPAQP